MKDYQGVMNSQVETRGNPPPAAKVSKTLSVPPGDARRARTGHAKASFRTSHAAPGTKGSPPAIAPQEPTRRPTHSGPTPRAFEPGDVCPRCGGTGELEVPEPRPRYVWPEDYPIPEKRPFMARDLETASALESGFADGYAAAEHPDAVSSLVRASIDDSIEAGGCTTTDLMRRSEHVGSAYVAGVLLGRFLRWRWS